MRCKISEGTFRFLFNQVHLSHMKKLKPFLSRFPEYYFILVSLLAGYTPPLSLNPLAVVFALVLVAQIIFTHKTLGFSIASLLALVHLFMLFALLSEWNEFTTTTTDSRNLLLFGIPLFLLNSMAIALMFRKYTHAHASADSRTQGV